MKYVFGHSGKFDLVFGKGGVGHMNHLPFQSLQSAKNTMMRKDCGLAGVEGSGTVYKLVPVYKVPGRIKR